MLKIKKSNGRTLLAKCADDDVLCVTTVKGLANFVAEAARMGAKAGSDLDSNMITAFALNRTRRTDDFAFIPDADGLDITEEPHQVEELPPEDQRSRGLIIPHTK